MLRSPKPSLRPGYGKTRKPSATVVWALVLFVLNVSAGSALLFAGDGNLAASLILFAAFVIFSIVYSTIFLSPTPRPGAFSASVYLGYGLILPAIYQVRANNFYWASGHIDENSLVPAALLTLLAVIAFYGGVAHWRRGGPASRQQDTRAPGEKVVRTGAQPSAFDRRGSFALLITTFSIATLCVFSFVRFGSAMFFSTRGVLWNAAMDADLDISTFGLLLALPRGMAIGGLALAGYMYASGMRGWIVNTSLALMVLANLLVNFPTALARFALLAILFALLLTVFQRFYFRYFRALFIVLPLALYGVFPILGGYNRGDELNFDIQHPGLEYLANGDLDGFQSTTNAIEYVNRHGQLYGQVLLSAGLFFVPRAVWSEKLEPSGVFVSESAGYTFTNISMPLQAELYLDGWYILSALGMFLIGRAASLMDSRYIAGLKSPMLGSIGVLLAGYFPIILRGALLGIIAGVAASMAVPLLWWLLVQMSGRRRRPRQLRPIRQRA